MDDAVRPSKEKFDQILFESYDEWSFYLKNAHNNPHLPPTSIELKSLLDRTPSFLGYGLISKDAELSFDCLEVESSPGQFVLRVSGQSTWTTSHGQCYLEPKTMPLDLLLAIPDPLRVKISNSTPLQEWPGVDGISDHDEGNYISILFLAWAYILSARWAESLKHASGHQSSINFTDNASQPTIVSKSHDLVKIDLGKDVEPAEAAWWEAIVRSDGGWRITTEYRQKTYLSPWSAILSDEINMGIEGSSPISNERPPSSGAALEYLARFCSRHRLYGQCSAALVSALYIPLLSGDSISLPVPKPALHNESSSPSQKSSNLVKEHSEFLSRYMTLSCNVWGMRSLLSSAFFNEEVECNLVSAWLNPIYALLNPLVQDEKPLTIAKVLGYRQPRLASLWLGANIVGVAKSTIRTIRIGLTATELNADLFSEVASEAATRGIFGWLRFTGYPANEKTLYRHSWIDIESSDDEIDDGDDAKSDFDQEDGCKSFVNQWLSRVDSIV